MKKIIIIFVIFIILILGLYAVSRKTEVSDPVLSSDLMSTALYSCSEGKKIEASFYEGSTTPSTHSDMPPTPGGKARVKLSDGRDLVLAQTISADGARYANSDESFVFWSKGNGALVLENNREKSYIGCTVVSPDVGNLSSIYLNNEAGFSIRLPSLLPTSKNGYAVDEGYRYQALGPGKDISGIKFMIPAPLADGTNLSEDSYLSVEQIPQTESCTANLFVSEGIFAEDITEGMTDYSVAKSSDAGAGNRYEETVYAIPGTNPCVAIRYFIHYTAIENYNRDDIKEFDKAALINEFDQIRRTLVINQ